MLRHWWVVLVAMMLVSLNGDPQPHETKQTQTYQEPPAPVANTHVEKSDAPTLHAEPDQHVSADVRVFSTPPKDRYDKAAFWINAALAFVGCIGIGVGVCTLIYLRKQASEMRLQRKVMVRSLRAMREQGERENKTIVLQYRPRVVVRSARATGLGIEPDVPGICKLEFLLVNLGGSSAHILDGSSVQLLSYIASDVDNINFIEGSTVNLGQGSLQPGQRVPIAEESVKTGTVNDADWMRYYKGEISGRSVILVGSIWYKDDLGITRQTSLYRPFDAKTGRFEPKKDHEDEYSD